MRKSHGRWSSARSDARYWLCRCDTCTVVYGLLRSGSRRLREDIGKAKCPACGTLLVRTQRIKGAPVCFITRKDARLA